MEKESIEALQGEARQAYERTYSDVAGVYLQAVMSAEIALQLQRIAGYLEVVADAANQGPDPERERIADILSKIQQHGLSVRDWSK